MKILCLKLMYYTFQTNVLYIRLNLSMGIFRKKYILANNVMISTFPPDALIWNKAYAVINIYEVNEFLLYPKSQIYGI